MNVFQALKAQLLQTEEERNRFREETQAYQSQLDQKMNQLAQMQEEVLKDFFRSIIKFKISRIERERLEMEELRRSADEQLEELRVRI